MLHQSHWNTVELIGHKSSAIFDLWSLFHILTGVAIGNIIYSAVYDFTEETRSSLILKTEAWTLLLLCYCWEFVEYWLEMGKAGVFVAYWLQGQEHWLNRLLSDPLLVLIGYMVSRRFKIFIWPARMILAAWIWIFITILPHSMAYL